MNNILVISEATLKVKLMDVLYVILDGEL